MPVCSAPVLSRARYAPPVDIVDRAVLRVAVAEGDQIRSDRLERALGCALRINSGGGRHERRPVPEAFLRVRAGLARYTKKNCSNRETSFARCRSVYSLTKGRDQRYCPLSAPAKSQTMYMQFSLIFATISRHYPAVKVFSARSQNRLLQTHSLAEEAKRSGGGRLLGIFAPQFSKHFPARMTRCS